MWVNLPVPWILRLMVQKSLTTTWDGAKTTVNSGDKLHQHQLVSQIFEPSTVCVMYIYIYIYSFCPYTPQKLEEEQIPAFQFLKLGSYGLGNIPMCRLVDFNCAIFFHQRHDLQALKLLKKTSFGKLRTWRWWWCGRMKRTFEVRWGVTVNHPLDKALFPKHGSQACNLVGGGFK